jgi:hypothetical protein
MTGSYVLRGTGEPVRVLCVDGFDEFHPVAVMVKCGAVDIRSPYGTSRSQYRAGDIIPAPPTAPLVAERGLYRMRNNRVILAICVDCPGPKPIVCVTGEGNYAGHWYANGRRDERQSEFDIVERIT